MGLLNPYKNIHAFDPKTSIPELTGRVIIVTGGNAGIGKQAVLELSRHNPRRLYLAARSRTKFDAALKDILLANPNASSCVEYLELDLANLKSIRAAANKVLAENTRLDILINNGGIMANPPALSADGYELQFATNYFGHAALTKLLMPLLQRTAEALPEMQRNTVRVVHVSSAAARLDQQKGKREDVNEYARYSISKLAQILYARQSVVHWPDVVHVAIQPGRVDTGLLDHYLGSGKRWGPLGLMQRTYDAVAGKLTVEEGALTPLWAATWTGDVSNGGMFSPVGVPEPGSAQCRDDKLAKALWDWTEEELRKAGI
ncbi:putative oxido [Cyphellophora attinorum]|uniref:Putative oxido n=1 Tax=Cyphellophora attinorum TaxID=1664694 RepID=A0A0N1HPD2_9EURO|nr:putative oxido [Phialophora attinorum]KPI39572.1 putative oxido [Phialophora attinorum]